VDLSVATAFMAADYPLWRRALARTFTRARAR